MTATENLWQPHAQRLADELVATGLIHDSRWAAAVASVPRHALVPVVYQQQPDGSWTNAADGVELIYSPTTLVTAVQDGVAVSSSTKPDLMVRMLQMLDIRDGDRVLEIGTGTGYNAALLSRRLGDGNVFSVDIDPELVDPARARLTGIGLHPRLATRDGAEGWPEQAPFDRIIATCSVDRVPWPWVEQLADGGVLLTDIKFGVGAGNLVLLRPRAGGLEGRFAGRWAAFMNMRPPSRRTSIQRRPRAALRGERATNAPAEPWNSHREVWMLACLGLSASLERGYLLDPDTRAPTTATLSAPDGSWSEAGLTNGWVREGGATRIWEHVERAFEQWRQWGEPGWERFGLTVTPEAHIVWLDDPVQAVASLH